MIKPGIKRSVLIIAVVPASAVALLLALIFSVSQIRNSEQSLTDRGFALVRQFAPASEYGIFSNNPNILQPIIDSILLEQDVIAVHIQRSDGTQLIHGGNDQPIATELDFPEGNATKFLSDDEKSWIFYAPVFQTEFSDNLFDESPTPLDSRSLRQSDRILGTVVLELSLERIHAYQTKIWISTSLIAVIVLLISAFLALRLGRRITEPVVSLKSAVSDIESGNLNPQLHSGASGELLSLESGIKSMANSLKLSRENLEDRVEQATLELRNTLAVLEQRNAELDTARSQAETANEAKSQFLAKISHEFRTPLNGIYGFLQLLKKSSLNSDQRDFVRKIGTSTESLLELINEILDFSKIEISEVQIKKSLFNLKKLLVDCLDVSLPEAQSKGLSVKVEVEDTLPEVILADAGHLAQVLRNLISNAVKFTDTGEVLVHASILPAESSGGSLRIAVIDTGIGIGKDDMEALFQPFSQLEPAMTRSHGGTGLGLAISKSLIELMGGSISVHSKAEGEKTEGEEKGSCFSITLPFEDIISLDMADTRETPELEPSLANSSFKSAQQLRVLLADDNDINRQFLNTWLDQVDALVDQACNGQEAVNKCLESTYDIILMDLHMPIMDGVAAARLIRQEKSKSRNTPIIAVTADVTDDTRKLLSASDINDYLVKPVREKELIHKLEYWQSQGTVRSTESLATFDVDTLDKKENKSVDRQRGIALASGNTHLWEQSLKNLATQLPALKNQLEKAFEHEDIEQINQITHNIAGAASYCGATELATAAKELRARAKYWDRALLEGGFQNIISAISKTLEWVEKADL